MSERTRAAMFEECLNTTLARGASDRLGTIDAADLAVLKLAFEIHDLDFARQSLVREGLGRALSAARSAPGTRLPTTATRWQGHPWRRVGIAAATIVLAITGITAASPRLRSAVADTCNAWFGRRVVMRTPAAGVDSLTAFWSQVNEGTYWSLTTTYGTAEGFVTRGMKPYSRHYAGLRALARDADFTVLAPTVWPAELPAMLRFQQGWLNPDGSVWLEFCTGPWGFGLSQTPVDAAAAATPTFEAAWVDTNRAAPESEATTFVRNGVTLTWKPMADEMRHAQYRWARPRKEGEPAYGTLSWRKDGIAHVLSGQNLTQARAEEIWGSLRAVER